MDELNVLQYLPTLIDGAVITIQITLLSIGLSLVLGFPTALMRLSSWRIVRAPAAAYAEFFRGTSALVQLFWLFYVLPHFGIFLDPFTVGWIALGLNIGAYGSEVVRGAILAVPKGQYEASTSLNMSYWKAIRRVIIPQAIPEMIPPWNNLFIELLKTTSLVSLITIADLTNNAMVLNARTLDTIEIFLTILVMYLIMALVITAVMRLLERRTARGLARGGA